MTALLELAERCEKATGPDRALDTAIEVAAAGFPERAYQRSNGARPKGSPQLDRLEWLRSWGVPPFTSSLDAALTLVPEGLGISTAQHGKLGDDCSAYVGKSDSDARGNFMTHTHHAEAKTMALALCAAALRARHSTAPSTHTESGIRDSISEGDASREFSK